MFVRVVAGACLVWGCSSPSGEVSGSVGAQAIRTVAEASESKLVIGTLQFRDRALVVSASGAGPRFTVRDQAGQVVFAELDEGALRATDPELWETYRNATVRGDGPYLDARLDRPVASQKPAP